MKKVFITFIIFFIVFGIIIGIFNIPFIKERLKSISNMIFIEQIEEYTDDFEINKLKVSNQSFYYNKLSDEQKRIYTCIANGVKKLDEFFLLQNYNIVDNDTTMTDIEKSMQAFFADHPEVFYVDNKYTVSTKHTFFNDYVEIYLTYSVSNLSELEVRISEIEGKIEQYLAQVSDKELFNAELVLHDLLGKNVEYYDYEDLESVPQECHTIYGAFINNKAVCDGFTKALQILLDRKNIENIIVLGNLEKESHAWNMVKLENEWYHVDLTSDKSIKDMNSSIVLHTYFNVTTEQIEKTHTIENKEIIPSAIQTKYNYYLYTGKNITVADDFNTKFKQILDENDNEYLVEFGVSGVTSVAEKMVDFLSGNRYQDYVANNKITYYSLLDSYVLVKNK